MIRKLALVNPNLMIQASDTITTGIVYMPVVLASAASALRSKGYAVKVIDSFAEGKGNVFRDAKYYSHGLNYEEISERIEPGTDIIVIYASIVIAHGAILSILRGIRGRHKDAKIVVMENAQAVSAYCLESVKEEFFSNGADVLVTGDAEDGIIKAINAFDGDIGEKGCKVFAGNVENLDKLPYPAWDLFPLEKYWSLGYAHGPFEGKNYLPILTSRGCPYNCRFCVAPACTGSKWRPRSAESVVSEMEYFYGKHGVREFHIEDLNPTISRERISDMCSMIKKKGLDLKIKIASGTKAETLDAGLLKEMRSAGFNYVSISPETGSKVVLEMMGKKFDHEHGLRIIGEMSKVGIKSQVCFVLGFPGETGEDVKLSNRYITELAMKGADEPAVFIITPVPGSKLYSEANENVKLEEMTFTPVWRSDFKVLSKARMWMYLKFFAAKMMFHPLKMILSVMNIMTGKAQLKMEMALKRSLNVILRGKGILRCAQR
ncbi:MAG: B12-binding domain-containing radical SAM protein [Endomicrobiales bacterium]|nr:B12-binding domain-containing radical SAM protein [Endomicrobiales bacterium]